MIARVDLRRDGAVAPGAWKALVRIPRIGDGYGALIAFASNFERSVQVGEIGSAGCPRLA